MAEAVPISLGDQVRVHFIGWPESVKAYKWTMVGVPPTEVDAPHPKAGQPFVMRWNDRPYTVHPGQDVYVPFDCAKVYFGDPRSLENIFRIKDDYGEDQEIPDRFAEVRRLQMFWQNSIIKFREYIPGDRSFLKDGISDLLPNVEVYSMAGERILMVTDDPYGDTVVVDRKTRAEESQTHSMMMQQSQTILELQKTNQLLLKKLGIRPEDLTSLDDVNLTPPPTKQPGSPVTPTNPVVAERPVMVFNPRTQRVEHKPSTRNPDPDNIEDIPTDLD